MVKSYGPIMQPASENSLQILFKLKGANLQITTDQPFTKLYDGASYVVTAVYARQRSGSIGLTCLGGIYTGANKTGDVLVAGTQSWTSLGVGGVVNALLGGAAANNLETATPFLSLSTGSALACTCDLYICGFDFT